jgi:hypothetical protein
MPHQEDNKAYAYFCVEEFSIDPDEITRRIGLQPTTFWRKGDLHPKTRLERSMNRWMLHSRLSRDNDLEAHVKDVLAQLDSQKEAFTSLCSEYGGYLQLVGYFYQYYPGFHLDREDTKRIGEYHLAIDCDFYYLYSEKREGTA